MKKIIFTVLAALVSAPVLFWAYGNYAMWSGRAESSWILKEMWGAEFFGYRSPGLEEFELNYLKSLSVGASKDQSLVDFFVKNKCYDGSWRCSVVMTTGSNLLIDGGDSKVGLRGAIEAYERVRGKCSIVYESSVLRYQFKVLSEYPLKEAKVRAATIVGKIKKNGGIMLDLRSSACSILLKKKPEYFTAYTVLVSELMKIAGGRHASAALHIDYLPK